MVIVFFTLYKFIHKNMERKEELWKRIKREICPLRDVSKVKRSSTDGLICCDNNISLIDCIQDDQVASPTFLRQLSTKTEVNDREALTFSFGQNLLHEIEQILKQSVNQKSENQLHPVCIECDSFCIRQSQKTMSNTNMHVFLPKISSLLTDFKYNMESMKLEVKKYEEEYKSQYVVWKNCIDLVMRKLEQTTAARRSEHENKIQQLKHQNYLYQQKIKMLQIKSSCLEKQVSQMLVCLSAQKSQNMSHEKKVAQLINQIDAKTRQIMMLTEENINLSMNLKKFMNLANSLNYGNGNSTNFNQSIVSAYDYDKGSKILKDFTNFNFQNPPDRTKNTDRNQMKVHGESFFEQSRCKDYFADFKESVQFRHASTSRQQLLSSPVIRRYCRKNSKYIQQSPQTEKAKLENSTQYLDINSRKQEMLGPKIRRNSTAATFTSRKSSWQLEAESKDKNQILERIQKLKNDISTEIKDLQKNA